MFIYQIRNKVNNKIYIGQTIQTLEERWRYHKRRLNKGNHTNPHLQNAWNKYGEQNFEFTMLEKCNTIEELNERESKLISQYPAKRKYNLRLGGDNGGPHAEETKLKISRSNVGKHSLPAKGKNAKGHTKSIQHIQSVIKSKVGKYPDVVSPFGEIHKIENVSDFCKLNGLWPNGIRNVMKGKYSHHRGWRLATEDTIGKRYNFYSILLLSPDDDIYTVENLNEFCKVHNLSAGNISQLISGKRKTHKGWKSIQISEK